MNRLTTTIRRSIGLRTLPRLVLAVAGVAMLGGCQQPLFPENMPRTQYERFDRLRGVYTPKERVGQFGDKVPALRERLQPYE